MNTIDTFEETQARLGVGLFGGVWVAPTALDSIGAAKGAYGILIDIRQPVPIAIKNLKVDCVPAGLYLYAGSAYGPGGIGARLKRHFRTDKTIHWHVDRLTLKAHRLAAFAVPQGQECLLVKRLQEVGLFTDGIEGFGSTDCRTCRSHLLTVQSHPKR